MASPALPTVTTLELQRSGGWLTIWFNRPDQRNALSDVMTAEIVSVFDAIRDDRGLRGITLRGRGGIFCAGADLKNFRDNFLISGDRDAVLKMSRDTAAIFDAVNEAPQVVIALIEGAAMAGGFGMACCADVVLCESNARFAMTETAIGLTPAQIAPFVVQKLGYAAARRLMLTAARFDGAEAQRLGFADFIADDAAGLEALELALKQQISNAAPGAIAATKSLLRDITGQPRDRVIALAAQNFADRMASDEARDGIAAFFEKRKPRWAISDEVDPH